jgi:hypothetical protein
MRPAFALMVYSTAITLAASAQITAEVRHPVHLSGKFYYPTGDPVQYEAILLKAPYPGDVVARVQTNGEGSFDFTGVLPGQFELIMHVPGYRNFKRPIDSAGGRDIDIGIVHFQVIDADLVNYPWKPSQFLGRPKRVMLSGRVVDKTGKGVSGALVSIPWSPGETNAADKEGMFALPGVPVSEGEYWLLAKAPGFDPTYVGPFQVRKGQKTINVGDITMKAFAAR